MQDDEALVSKRAKDWARFYGCVHDHIENYTVPQYGDKGQDLITTQDVGYCIFNAKKYLERFGKSSRPGEELLDLMKAAHYIEMAWTKMQEKEV